MSEISSGLVAHIAAFKKALNGTKGDLDAWLECNDESEVRQAIFGVISNAEAKLSECVTSYEKEVAGLTAELNAKDEEIERLFKDRGINHDLANRFGFENNDLRSKVAKQSAALKLARQTLTSITEKPRAYEGIRMASQALAAIDALKGE